MFALLVLMAAAPPQFTVENLTPKAERQPACHCNGVLPCPCGAACNCTCGQQAKVTVSTYADVLKRVDAGESLFVASGVKAASGQVDCKIPGEPDGVFYCFRQNGKAMMRRIDVVPAPMANGCRMEWVNGQWQQVCPFRK